MIAYRVEYDQKETCLHWSITYYVYGIVINPTKEEDVVYKCRYMYIFNLLQLLMNLHLM